MKTIKKKKKNSGFTFIELLITLAVIAIAFLPLMRMFSVSLEQAVAVSDLTTARYLAQEGMERLKNLGFTESQIASAGNTWNPSLNKAPLEINNRGWRVLRKVIKETDPLEVRIEVYRVTGNESAQPASKPVVQLAILIEDFDWATFVQ